MINLPLVAAFFFAPALFIYACLRLPALDKIGAVVICFAMGISLSYLIPSSESISSLQVSIAEISIALALPLLLFSIDVKGTMTQSRNTMKIMCITLLSVFVVSLIGVVLFEDYVPDLWQVAGMSVGAYTGGGPNMAAIKTAIGADEAIFLSLITYDILFSALFLLFVITIGKHLAGMVLAPYKAPEDDTTGQHIEGMEHMADESANSYRKLVAKATIPKTLLALLCSLAVVGASALLAELIPETYQSTGIIVLITSLGIALSFIPRIRSLPNTFQLGMYLVLVFCFTSGSMVDASIIESLNLYLAAYIFFILIGSIIVQITICKLMKVDRDTFLITITAAIMSVPFIPVVAGALKNKAMIVPGFAAAIIGYAVGNYLGIIVANVSRALVG